jgi:putative colanic acid biosynthesis UDP-glucose lipid carrier transferase
MFMNRKIHIDFFGDIPILSLRREPLESFGNRAVKRLFDVAFSVFIIVFILTWLLPILAIIIKLDSNGPVFFVQKRSGWHNRDFICLKFRTMCVNNESHLKQATKDDGRVTRVGRFLRKTNLDEMPQFFNVLFSQMSVVGPRPHMLKHTGDYSKLISKFMVRQFLKPGITGWAQVSGYRGQTETLDQMEKRVEYDIWYMENWSILLDLRIVLKTAFMFFKLDKKAF